MFIPTSLRSGVTCAVLKPVGKVPSEKVRFVNLAMIAAKAPPQSLSKEVGMKSRGDDLPDNDESNLRTSSSVTGNRLRSAGPRNGLSSRRASGVTPYSFKLMAILIVMTLSRKKVAQRVARDLSSSGVPVV